MRLHDDETAALYRAVGAWTDERIDQLFDIRVREHPNIPALVDPLNREDLVDGGARTLTWQELDDLVWRTAGVLHAVGVRAGSIVGVQLPNAVEIVATFLAIVRLGGIVCPFPVQYRSHELSMLCDVAKVEVFVTSTRIGKRLGASEVVALRDRSPSLTAVLAWGENCPPGVLGLDVETSRVDPASVRTYVSSLQPDARDCVTICWTSGTESTPKGVLRAHCDWLAACTTTVDGPHLTPEDVLLNPFPMVNMAGINGMFLPWLRVGGLLVQHHPFDLGTFLRQIEFHRATYTVAPPALLTQLLMNEQLLADTDISSIRLLGSGSTPLAPSLLERWHERYGIEILNFYGSNEGIPLIGLPEDIPDPAERAVYFPRLGMPNRVWSYRVSAWTTSKIFDLDTGLEITEPGHPGELRIKGPTVFGGYLPASGVPEPFDENGYLRTGDLLEIAGQDGEYLHYVDRVKDIVVRGGVKIAAAEIEALLAGHPSIADVAVVGYPDDVYGERVCAFVVPRSGSSVTFEGIIEYLRGLDIATFKLPERLMLVDQLPRNPVGKLVKRELRSQLVESGH